MAAVAVGSAYGKIVIDTGGVRSGVQQANSALGTLHGAASTAAAAVTAAAVAIGAAVVGIGVKSVGAAKDMEASMSDIASVMNTSVEAIAPLGELIQDLGLDPQLKVTADEAAAAIAMLARNGLDMGQILEGAAYSTVLLANATGAEFGNAANIATDAMAVFGIRAEDMQEAVNGIVSVTTSSKFSINDYAMALAQGGGVASAAGVEFADFNTAIAAMSPLFASGSDAGTSFKTMLQRLIPQSEDAAGWMRDLGIITDEAGNRFFDAQGNLKDMSEIAGILEGALGGLSEAQRNDALATIFGTDAMRAAVGMMRTGRDGFEELAATMAETDAVENAATRMDNLAGVLEILRGVGEALMLSLGNGLLPIFRLLADNVLAFAAQVMPAIEAGLAIASEVIGNFIAALESGMSPIEALSFAWATLGRRLGLSSETIRDVREAVIGFIEQVTAVKDAIMEAVQPVLDWLAGFVGIEDVLLAVGLAVASVVLPAIASIVIALAPIIATAAAVVLAVAALRTAWETNFGGIRDYAAGIWQAIQSAWAAFKALFSGDWDGFLTNIEAAWNTAWNAVAAFLGNLWAMVQPKLAEWFAAVSAWFASVDWKGLALTVITFIAEKIGELWAFVLPKLVEWHNAVAAWFESIDWKQLAFDLITKILRGLEEFWTRAKPAIETWWTDIRAWFAAIDWGSLAQMIIDGLVSVLRAGNAVRDALMDMARGAWDAVVAFFQPGSPSRRAMALAETIPPGLAGGIMNTRDTAVRASKELAQAAFAPLQAAVAGMGGAPAGSQAQYQTQQFTTYGGLHLHGVQDAQTIIRQVQGMYTP